MDRIQGEPFRFDCPLFADELVGREAFEGLQTSPEVVGADEVGEVLAQPVVVIVVEALDGRVLDRAIPLPGSGLPANRERDPLDLAAPRENRPPDCFLGLAAPGMLDLGQPVFDLMLAADAVEAVLEGYTHHNQRLSCLGLPSI